MTEALGDLLHVATHQWWAAFLFTAAMELPVYWLFGRRWASPWRCLAAGIVGTAITHPLLWFVWTRAVHSYAAYLATGELLVVALEALVFFLIARPGAGRRALMVSAAANAASFSVGFIIQRVF